MRFLIKSHENALGRIDVSFTVGAWGRQQSHLHLTLEEAKTGRLLDAPPVVLQFPDDAFDLTGAIKADAEAVRIVPHASLTSQLTASRYAAPAFAIDQFSAVSGPIPMSKRVRRRG